MERFIIQDREAGNVIEINLTFEEATKKVSEFENSDKKEGIYVPDFYEIRAEEEKSLFDLHVANIVASKGLSLGDTIEFLKS